VPTSGLISIAGSSIAVAEGSVSCARGKSRESHKKLRGSNRFANYNATVRRLSSLSQVHIYFLADFFSRLESPVRESQGDETHGDGMVNAFPLN
jgi:hypothetical protein